MKFFIVSDIHGSEYYCQKAIDAFFRERADKMLLLGDILYHGPRNDLPKGYNPKRVIELLNEINDKILCVRGNCDTEVDQMVLSFPILADYALIAEDGVNIYLSHGHRTDELSKLLKKGDILLCGHTHVPACEDMENYTYINPGSASIPKNGSHNGYMIFKNSRFYWKDFDGNVILEYSVK